jgi:lipopolysaccharide export LptBFGC system permease protein LptF
METSFIIFFISMLNAAICIRIMRYKDIIVEIFPTIVSLGIILVLQFGLQTFELYKCSIALSLLTILLDWIYIIKNKSKK